MMKPGLQNIGNAGEYYVASILSSYGYTTTITLGRAEKYDIIAISPEGKTIKIQVKTAWYDNHTFRLSPKDEAEKEKDCFYAFVTMKENKTHWEYFIIPTDIVAKFVREMHKSWLSTLRRDGQEHKDSLMRVFLSRPNKYCPSWFTQELIDSYKNTIKAIEDA